MATVVVPGATVPVATVLPASGFVSGPGMATVVPGANVPFATVIPASGFGSAPHPTPQPGIVPTVTVPAPSLVPADAGLLPPTPPVAHATHLDDSSASKVENVAPCPAPIPALRSIEPFKLPPIPDSKAFLNLSSILQYYLRRPEFSTLRSDGELITDARNADASAYWEGQLRVAVQDGSFEVPLREQGLRV
jgi:hypothetical protein